MNISLKQGNSSAYPEMSKADFDIIAKFALAEFGLSLPASKLQLVKSRVARRLRVLNLAGYSEYRSFLEGPDGEVERTELLSALTTNVTKFFREIHHFDILLDDEMPKLVARAQGGAHPDLECGMLLGAGAILNRNDCS